MEALARSRISSNEEKKVSGMDLGKYHDQRRLIYRNGLVRPLGHDGN